MEITTINTELVAKMFLAGAKNLDAKKEWINELNVFPVPDGDTGTNMSMTIMSAAREVSALEKPEMKALAKAISSGSLRGARGNSGVILSQLFRGFTKVIAEYDEINVQILSDSFQKAVETAYKAVMKPKEGTILTVAKGMSDRALELCDDTEDLVYFCEEVIKEGDRVLDLTPEMLPVLKQAGVVDSGGQGLMQVMKGAMDALLGKEVDYTIEGAETIKKAPESTGTSYNIEAQANQEIKFAYCTQFLIMLDTPITLQQENEFKSYLETIGDSIVVVADDEIVKVHVHTNDPGLAMQRLMEKGYGFGAEGDWKTAAMVRLMKVMTAGKKDAKGTSFMEDYTYNLVPGKEGILQSHMLEVCPTIADGKISIKEQPLSMGNREDPARLVFTSKTGPGIATSLIDLGDRFRLIINDVDCKKVEKPMPKLPVATNFWTPQPDLYTGAEAWILAGGAHHTAFTYDLTAEQMGDWAEAMGIEPVYIDNETTIRNLKKDLMLGNLVYRK